MRASALTENKSPLDAVIQDSTCLLVTRDFNEIHHRLINRVEGLYGRIITKEALEQKHLFNKRTVIFDGYDEREAISILNQIGLTKLQEGVQLLIN